MSNCKEIQQNVREIEILKKELEETAKEALKTGDISAVARLKKALNEKMIELQVNIIDAHPSNQEVGLGERWRIAKEKGFDCVYQFGPEGTAVAHKGLHMMLIDKQGTIVAGPYDGIDQFMGGIATAAQGNERFYIDQKGREITSERFERISWFSEGFAYVGKGDVFWYIDTNGKRLTEQNFVHASPFKEGRALVQIAGEGYSYIDTSGNKIGEEEFSEAQDFSEGLAAVKGHNRPAHFIDTSGKDPFGKDFVATSSFVDGIARVSIFTTINGSVRQTFINKYGEFIHRGIETKYDQAEDFSEGRAAVKIYSPGETWNYIDTNGRYASLAGSFEKARSFQGGFGRVRRSSRWNYVGMNRELLLSEFVEDAGDFSDGIAEIKKSDDDNPRRL
jgi:hypothetical protein